MTQQSEAPARRPFLHEPRARIKPHRAGTRRAKTVELLLRKEGAFLGEIQAECGWTPRQASEAVYLVHKHLGYGLRTGPDGRIRAYTAEEAAQ